MSVRLSAPTEWIFVKLCNGDFYEYLLRKSKFDYNLTKTSATSRRDRSTFVLLAAAQDNP